ncbi:SDR family NAD(P)-dependent oxidoreductase [Halobium salinum]|uniref:SDR family NAD(P)-dependent oxidoreductase n=1 Tax=Halobium salinum TaxID=1364940 RepID=A0ABD5PAF7_9EURY|nr:SDR family oxidoreductase [Halobium salinum]
MRGTTKLKTIVVTGASSGIGRSLVEHLAVDEGYHVLALARRIDRMEEEFAEVDSVTPRKLDLSDLEGTRETIRGLIDEFGPIPYLVNNAGVNVGGPLTELDPEDVLYSMRVNALAPFVLMQELVPRMADTGFGRVVNVTSGAPIDCPSGTVPYTSSKAALNAMTVITAKEYASTNVKINLMSPGPCETEMAPNGPLDPAECHPTADYLLTLPEGGPTGGFFWLGYEIPLFPDLGDIRWEQGQGSDALQEVL